MLYIIAANTLHQTATTKTHNWNQAKNNNINIRRIENIIRAFCENLTFASFVRLDIQKKLT